MTSHQEVKKIVGIIQIFPKAVEKDIARVLLVAEDGADYPVLHKGAGVDLIDHVGGSVEVTAVFEDTPELEGGKALKVRSYSLTDDDDYTWYDEDE